MKVAWMGLVLVAGCGSASFTGLDDVPEEDGGADVQVPLEAAQEVTPEAAPDVLDEPEVDAAEEAKPDPCAGEPVSVNRFYNWVTGEHIYRKSKTEPEGFTLEFPDYFSLQQEARAGVEPFYECEPPAGRHFYSTDATCAGGTNKGLLGYISGDADCESVPLHHLTHPNDNLYTVKEDEREFAVTAGYTYDSVVGYVWLSD